MNDVFFFSLLVCTFVGAGLVKGISGMGLPTVAMGLLGSALPPAEAAALMVIPSFVTNVWQLLAGPSVQRLLSRLWPMLLGIVVGTLAASALLARANPRWSGLALGSALVLYAGYAFFAPARAVPPRAERWWALPVGALTGAITGATGVFVIPAVPYLQALRLERDALVQALGLSFTVSTLALALGLAAHGVFRLEQVGLSVLALGPALLGMWLGQRLRARMPAQRFRQCFLVFLALLGLELVSRAFR
jgi:uncharacterized membrane protein YfcA